MALEALRHFTGEDRRQDPTRLDPITLLPNRRQFHADAALWGNSRATLVLVSLADAGDFNEILRVLGHARSDDFIRAGAARMREVLGPGTAIYHVNLLSFVFRLPGHTEPSRPPLIDRLLQGFRAPIHCDDVPIATRVGIGLKGFGGVGMNPGEDLRAALAAAQDSRGTLSGWCWYDHKSDEAHRRAFRLLTDLKLALDDESQLELHFQPKVGLTSGECRSVEALLRWNHPVLGPVSPGEFVGLAETTALVTPMTRWVVEAATRQAAAWAREGLDLVTAFNISPKNLEEPDFVEFLLFCCEAQRLDRSRIEIEVTEGVSAARSSKVLDKLSTLARLGFSIAIDDFGSGYSNMSYLTRLSAHTLKIDQSLVRGVRPDTRGGQLVSSIVQMGRDLGYRVVAEGIESEAERGHLARWGCDLGQGWHFARAMPADVLRDWLDNRTPAAATPVRRIG